MSGFENWPAPILRRWLLSAAAGPVIFLIGLAGRIALHDPTLLTLSTLLASCMVVRCILLFQAIRQGDYRHIQIQPHTYHSSQTVRACQGYTDHRAWNDTQR